MAEKTDKKADPQQRFKKFLKGPWLWIAIALSVVFIGSTLMNTEQYAKVDTQVGL